MTIEEYSRLMGYDELCSFEEYEEANLAYMAARDMDKQEFCEDYKAVGKSRLVQELALEAETHRRELAEETARGRRMVLTLLKMASHLRDASISPESVADSLDGIASSVTGMRTYIKWKIEHNAPLNDSDLRYIAENIR